MPDVFSVLEADHLEVKSMLGRLTGSQLKGKSLDELAEQLVIEESKHEAVEEMYFWPAVREHVPAGDQLADRALEQEREGKEVLDQLRKEEAGTPAFQTLIRTFAQAGSEHIAFEEEQVWPKLRAALTASEREELGTKLEEGKRTAPTRPHPHGPDSPGGLKTVGGAAAMADKVRDSLSDRG